MNDIEIFSNTGIEKSIIDKVVSRLPEYRRGSGEIGHSTSQHSYSLQTMNMISDSPMSRLKQCLAQIHKRFQALRESHFIVENHKLEIASLMDKTDAKSILRIDELRGLVFEIRNGMIQSFKQISMFQDMYDSILENNNIPKDWTEKDFEKQEMSNMVKSSFRIGIQDLTAYDRISRAAVEYWEQLGIHPQTAEKLTRNYLFTVNEIVESGKIVSINVMYEFLDSMVELFGECYKLALKRIGLNDVGGEGFIAQGVNKPR